MPGVDELLDIARRDLDICNACRYCEGYCAVFPAMERSIDFTDPDIMLLANLCHDCRGCYQACMYAPPHEFAVDLPKALADVRNAGYESLTWPRSLSGLLRHPVTAKVVALLMGLVFVVVATALHGGRPFARPPGGPGAFYRVISDGVMTGVFLGLGLLVLLALTAGTAQFVSLARRRRDVVVTSRDLMTATWHAVTLRYLRGGGPGCYQPLPEVPSHRRRLLHIAVVAGLGLAFLATLAAAFEQHILGEMPPYPLVSVPVILGVIGGVAVVAGACGLTVNRFRTVAQDATAERPPLGDHVFTTSLIVVAATGLLLFILRSTAAMGVLLEVHLACVVALYLTLPYGKFVHATHRMGALVLDLGEQRAEERTR